MARDIVLLSFAYELSEDINYFHRPDLAERCATKLLLNLHYRRGLDSEKGVSLPLLSRSGLEKAPENFSFLTIGESPNVFLDMLCGHEKWWSDVPVSTLRKGRRTSTVPCAPAVKPTS